MEKNYMTRLARWARWMLPPQEAEDVIADYRDIVADEELSRELGRPRQVVKPLAQTKQYRIWMAVFAMLAACILVLGVSPTGIGLPFWLFFFDEWAEYPLGPILAVLGAAGALVWFRWQGHKEERLPRAIPILLAALLAYIGGVLLFCWMNTQDYEGFAAMWGTMKPLVGPNNAVPRSLYLSQLAMIYTCPFIALAGVLGLANARMGDRRWAAVYLLALTAILAALLVLHLARSLTAYENAEALAGRMLARCSVTAVVGLISTGVALC